MKVGSIVELVYYSTAKHFLASVEILAIHFYAHNGDKSIKTFQRIAYASGVLSNSVNGDNVLLFISRTVLYMLHLTQAKYTYGATMLALDARARCSRSSRSCIEKNKDFRADQTPSKNIRLCLLCWINYIFLVE